MPKVKKLDWNSWHPRWDAEGFSELNDSSYHVLADKGKFVAKYEYRDYSCGYDMTEIEYLGVYNTLAEAKEACQAYHDTLCMKFFEKYFEQ